MFFFFNDTATTEIYTLSLHDALPIWSNLELNDRNVRSNVAMAEVTFRKVTASSGFPPKAFWNKRTYFGIARSSFTSSPAFWFISCASWIGPKYVRLFQN